MQIITLKSGDVGIKGVHALAELFPEIKGDDFRKLTRDIRDHGLLQPIVMDGDILIDGRQRLRACKEAGIEPRFVQFAELELKISVEDFIWSENVNRRHLTDDQRAMLSTKWADAIRKAAKEKSKANLKKGDQKPEVVNSPPRGKTRSAIAKQANVSEHKIRQAETVRKTAPDLESKVIAGEMKLKDATALAQPKREAAIPRGGLQGVFAAAEKLTLGTILLYPRRKQHGAALELVEVLNRVQLFSEQGSRITVEARPSQRPDRIIVWRGPGREPNKTETKSGLTSTGPGI